MVGSYWVCHWKKTFWVGGCDGIGGLAYLLFCAAYWSRQPRVFRHLSRYCELITVMSLLEAPCAKTSWRALLFRTILGITGALIVCFDIWWFKQVNNSETGFSGHHCDFGQHVPCLAVHVCINSVKFVLKAPGASILWGRYYSVTMCRLIRWALLLGRALLIGTLRYVMSGRDK